MSHKNPSQSVKSDVFESGIAAVTGKECIYSHFLPSKPVF